MTPYYSDDLVTIYHGDALELASDLPPVDLLLTDPPYFMPAEPYAYVHPDPRKRRQRLWGDTSVLSTWWRVVVDRFAPLLRHDAHWMTFCDDESYPVFYPTLYSRFAQVSALVWDKGSIGPGRPWRHTHELIIDARPPMSKWRGGTSVSDIIREPRGRTNEGEGHYVDKPVSLLRLLIEPVSDVGDLVLDPFVGGGSTLVAAKSLGRRGIGVEIEEKWCEIAAQRCSQATLGLSFLETTAVRSAVQEPLPMGEDAA